MALLWVLLSVPALWASAKEPAMVRRSQYAAIEVDAAGMAQPFDEGDQDPEEPEAEVSKLMRQVDATNTSAEVLTEVDVSLTCPTTSNLGFPKSHRVECGQNGLSHDSSDHVRRSKCENAGCCWQPLEHGSKEPWCFQKPQCATVVPATHAARKECSGFQAHAHSSHSSIHMRGRACESLGCCWQPLQHGSGVHWCFLKPHATATPTSRPASVSTPSPTAVTPTPTDATPTPTEPAPSPTEPAATPTPTDSPTPTPTESPTPPPTDSPTSTPTPPPTNPPIEKAGTLIVHVDSATDLPDTDSWGAGKTDAYVKVTVGSTVKQSPTKHGTLNPVWNWHHTFTVTEQNAVVNFCIWDQDAFINFWWNGHDHIHSMEVPFRAWAAGTEKTFSEAVPQGGKGRFKFRLKFVPKSR